MAHVSLVVNCFQICIFVSDDTAQLVYQIEENELWIAFKFVSLYRMTQLLAVDEQLDQRCELLSNLYLCIGWHSLRSRISRSAGVVNCFQICIFVSDDTACSCDISIPCLLWIAFKFVSLYRMTQPSSRVHRGKIGCELLSNLYLCIGWHSLYIIYVICVTVVNCFQICIFVSDDTAASRWCLYPSELWIAFKFVSLYRMTQRASPVHVSGRRCELLSNLYLCIGWHSLAYLYVCPMTVVNCFQICIFVSDDTAIFFIALCQL